jgi:hypothetical protein
MRRRAAIVVGVLGCATASACTAGGLGTSAPSPSGHAPAAARSASSADPRLLGHYAPKDGGTGFVLDRSVEPPRFRLDGTDQTWTLRRQTTRAGSFELVNPDGQLWLRVDEASGEVALFDGPEQAEGVAVTRDADGAPL